MLVNLSFVEKTAGHYLSIRSPYGSHNVFLKFLLEWNFQAGNLLNPLARASKALRGLKYGILNISSRPLNTRVDAPLFAMS